MGIVLRGYDALLRIIDPVRALKRVQRKTREAMHRLGAELVREMTNYIDSEKHGKPNAPLTVLLKGSSKPLVEKGDMRMSLAYDLRDTKRETVLEVGVTRKASKKMKKGKINVALLVHDGFEFRVTWAQKRYIMAQLRLKSKTLKEAEAKLRSFAAGNRAAVWRVPPRPFVRESMQDADLRIKLALGDAVEVIFKDE